MSALPLAGAHRGAPELRQEPAPVGGVRRQQRERALEHHDGCGKVLASERAPPRDGEERTRLTGERERMLVRRDELGAVAMGLFEVVGEDLVVLAEAPSFAGLLLEPAGEALVELGADGLRDPGIRLVADQ